MDTQLERKIWFDYISKLNDRALIKQRSSGLTTWAILGVLALLISQIIPDIIKLTTDSETFSLYILSSSIISNTTVFTFLLLVIFYKFGVPSNEVRVLSKFYHLSKPILFLPIFLSLCIFSGINYLSIYNSSAFNISSWPFTLLFIFFMLNAASIIFIPVVKYFMNRKHFRDLPELSNSNPLGIAPPPVLFERIISTIIIVILLSTSLIPVLEAFPRITKPVHINAIEWSSSFILSIYLIIFLFFRVVVAHRNSYLRALERKIVMASLSPQEIAADFQKELIGETLRDWISKSEEKMKELANEFDLVSTNAYSKFEELSKIDSSLTYEIEGRRKEICLNLTRSINKFIDYSEKLVSQTRYLLKQSSDPKFLELFNGLHETWKKKILNVKERYNSVCQLCEKTRSIHKIETECKKKDISLISDK